MTATITQSRELAHCRRQPLALLPLIAVAAAILVGCGNMIGDAPGTANPTAEPPPSVATAVARAEATVAAVSAKVGTDYCGRLCQPAFWMNASVADLDAEISKGASVNATGARYQGSPLHYAVWYADISVIAALLDRGADIEAKDYAGQTALHNIVRAPGGAGEAIPSAHSHSDQDNIAALLLERGADVNAQDYRGYTPLHYANDPVTAALLLNYGADVNAVNEHGQTPLFASPYYRYGADVVALLVEHGVDINARDRDGLTACQVMRHYDHLLDDAIQEMICP